MSRRELKSLLTGLKDVPTRKSRLRGSNRDRTMSEGTQVVSGAEVAELRAKLATRRQKVEDKDVELDRLRSEVSQIKADTEVEVLQLQKQLEEARTLAELDRFRAMEGLREEHQRALRREQAQVDLERERAREQLRALSESFAVEKADLEKKVEELSQRVKALTASRGPVGVASSVASVAAAIGDVSTETDGSGVSVSTGVGTETVGSGVSIGTGVSTETDGSGVSTETVGSGVIAETGGSCVSAGTSTGIGPVEEGSHSLVVTMSRLLKAHTEAIAAQTQAAAAQHLPPLKPYSGEGKQIEDDGLDRWLEQFEERAKIAGWSAAQ